MKMPHSPKPWSYHEPSRQPVPSEHDLPMIVSEGGGIVARLRACANPRMTFADPSLPDVGDIPEYRDGWAMGFAVAQTNGRILGLALEMAEAIVAYVDEIGSYTTTGGIYISPELMAVLNLAVKLREIKGLEPMP